MNFSTRFTVIENILGFYSHGSADPYFIDINTLLALL